MGGMRPVSDFLSGSMEEDQTKVVVWKKIFKDNLSTIIINYHSMPTYFILEVTKVTPVYVLTTVLNRFNEWEVNVLTNESIAKVSDKMI